MRTLFTKGHLACEEIASRLACSKQAVNMHLRRMGVDTKKRRLIVTCSQCSDPVEKTRGEVRAHENHFCSAECYAEYVRRPEVQERIMLEKVIRDKCMEMMPAGAGLSVGFYAGKEDTYVFRSREKMLEWKRTGLPEKVWSMNEWKEIEVSYKEGL